MKTQLLVQRPKEDHHILSIDLDGLYIMVGRVANYYVAYLHEQEEDWATGNSPEEAIGRLIITYATVWQSNINRKPMFWEDK